MSDVCNRNVEITLMVYNLLKLHNSEQNCVSN